MTAVVIGVPIAVVALMLAIAFLRDRHVTDDALRDALAQSEVAADRAQLAADLERMLQCRLSALCALADRGPTAIADGTAISVLAEIEAESRATLDQMRVLVGVLRDEPDICQMADVAPRLAG